VTAAPLPALEEPSARRENAEPLVLLVGNPNVGKTSLFNRLTGERAHIGNYPGITVERRAGRLLLPDGRVARVVDLPGAYSLAARSPEEQIALEAALGLEGHPRPDLAIVVVDASQLARNLYIALELAELEVPLVVAVNMLDEATDNPPRLAGVSELFGVPVVGTDARHGRGIDELTRLVAERLGKPPAASMLVPYSEALLADARSVAETLPESWKQDPLRDRALALWLLGSVDRDDELTHVPRATRERCLLVRAAAEGRDLDEERIGARYAFIDKALPSLYARMERHPPKRKGSERVDRLLLHPVWGFAIFLGLMLIVFQALFSWSDPAISLIEDAMAAVSNAVSGVMSPGILRDLIVDGVIGGVGNVIVFLPQILLLSLFIGLLEDSGYMARVAFLMDRVLKALGLHGRAFVPMLSGFACAVPAVLATRTMERQRDRTLTMLVIPLMTCSARLPVYTLVIATLFPPSNLFGWVPVQGLLMVAMYVFAIVTTLLVALILGRTVVKARRIPLILELPPYRLPSPSVTIRTLIERASVFLREAGTVILACTVVLWALLAFPREALPPEPGAGKTESAATAAPAIERSYAGRLGKAIEPVFEPLGFDWKLDIGIIGAFAAREVFVSTLGLVYGVEDADETATPLRDKLRAETVGGKPRYTPLVGLSLMVFFALACQCMSTLAVVKRETRSYRWPAFLFAYMTVLAYAASFVVYQGGKLLGFDP
jgi:ferrous iron transport protein B